MLIAMPPHVYFSEPFERRYEKQSSLPEKSRIMLLNQEFSSLLVRQLKKKCQFSVVLTALNFPMKKDGNW